MLTKNQTSFLETIEKQQAGEGILSVSLFTSLESLSLSTGPVSPLPWGMSLPGIPGQGGCVQGPLGAAPSSSLALAPGNADGKNAVGLVT